MLSYHWNIAASRLTAPLTTSCVGVFFFSTKSWLIQFVFHQNKLVIAHRPHLGFWGGGILLFWISSPAVSHICLFCTFFSKKYFCLFVFFPESSLSSRRPWVSQELLLLPFWAFQTMNVILFKQPWLDDTSISLSCYLHSCRSWSLSNMLFCIKWQRNTGRFQSMPSLCQWVKRQDSCIVFNRMRNTRQVHYLLPCSYWCKWYFCVKR